MRWRNDETHWGAVTIALHWLVVVLVLALALIGLSMDEMPNSPAKVEVYALHKSLGITVLALMLLRLAWRLVDRRPRHLADTPTWQRRAAGLTHGLLYALLLAMPLSGWLYNSAANFPLTWFGLVKLPALGGFDPELKAIAHEAHELLFVAIAVTVSLHAGAALWHHFRIGDATLLRMLPRFARPPEPLP